ncbi:hypothetical protein KKC32_04520 [Patescibacteria group bacterium]|nr:hypothetical protein [Patescibacteria group bacterium]
MSKNKKKQTIGFWDKGKETTLINCSSEGFDIGLKSEGEGLLAKNFKSLGNTTNSDWYEKWWMKYIIFPLAVLIIGAFVIFYIGLN